MTLLFMDGFDDGLLTSKWNTANTWTNNSGNGRNGNGVGTTGSNSATMTKPLGPGAHATVAIGCAFRVSAMPGVTTTFLTFYGDGGSTAEVTIELTPSGQIAAYRGGVTLLGTSTATIAANTFVYLEAKVHLDPTAGTVDVHLNGASILSVSGVSTRQSGSATVLDAVRFAFAAGSTVVTSYDDVYILSGAGSVNNDFLGDCVVETVKPNGNGAHSDFVNDASTSTNNYSHVNEAAPDTTTWVQSATVGAKDSYTVPSLVHAGAPAGVQINHYAEKTDAGARAIAPLVRIAATDYTVATEPYLSQGAFTDSSTILETNPATSAAWASGDVGGAEWGVTVAA